MKTQSNIKVRPATLDDKEFIISLLPRLIEFGPSSWRDGAQMTEVDARILSDKLIKEPEGTAVFIAQDIKKNSLGFIHIQPGADYYINEKHAHISDLIVAPAGKGQGIGNMRIEKAEEWSRSQGFHWLTLSVFAQNLRAREFMNGLDTAKI